MNVHASVARLPEKLRQVIASQPSVSVRLQGGMSLPEVLSSAEWAEEWAAGASGLRRFVMGRLLLRFGSHAFGEEKGEAEAMRESQVTGAEWRAALAFLRRCGIVFAVCKTWGERMYYIPDDMIPVWQRILLPVCAQPLTPEESTLVRRVPGPPRLPLPLEMLCVWSWIRRAGIQLTAKGRISKTAAARLAAETRLKPEELAPLRLVYPQQDIVPPGAALALDLGLRTGVLRKGEKEIGISPGGLPEWMRRSMKEVNADFYRLVMQRYASADPRLHLAASAAATLRTEAWYRDEEIAKGGMDRKAAEEWLQLLTAFGWAERGEWKDGGCFRLSSDLDGLHGNADKKEENDQQEGAQQEDAQQEGAQQEDAPRLFIQLDGDILVPPDAGLAERWDLEEIAERIAADRMFVYRLTRKACAKAYENGRNEQAVRRLLELGSGAPLPEPVSKAISDWFRFFGRTRIEENVVLLRTDSGETAQRLLEDEETSGCLLERIAERDFIADRSKLGVLKKRLEYLGYAALAPKSAGSEGPAGSGPTAETAGGPEFISAHHGQLAIYRPDPAVDSAEAMFPGLSKIPAAWLTRPGSYHATTRRELIGQAIAWRTAVQVGEESSAALFVPQSLNVRGEFWEVQGYWKHSGSASQRDRSSETPDFIKLTSEEAVPLKIVLPAFDDSC